MVHEIFDTNQFVYDDFIQIGSGMADGLGSIHEQFNYYQGGSPFQRGGQIQGGGAAIGNMFRGLWRFFLPLIRRAGTTISEEALVAGQRALERMKEGEPVKEALLTEAKKGADQVLTRGGFPKQFGTGKAIKRRHKAEIPSHLTLIGRAVKNPVIKSKKRLRSDAFGLY